MPDQQRNEYSIPNTDGLIIEGAVTVNIVRPNGQRFFKDYVEELIIPYVENSLKSAERVDIVWDIYKQGSLKSQTRQARGNSGTHKMTDNALIPRNWAISLEITTTKLFSSDTSPIR